MKIVIINTVCDTGSTGRIAANIGRLASKRGHEIFFAYGRGTHPGDINGIKISNKLDFYCHVIVNFISGRNGFASKRITTNFIKELELIKPDVIHLHNLHGFYINIKLLFEYIKKNNIAVVWTFHDCWPFTGQCAHFDYAGCNKWKTECCHCPIYRTNYPYSIFCDNSYKNYYDKKEIFTGVKNLKIITPSKWLAELVKESFLREYSVELLNNGIDLDKFAIRNNNDKINYKYNLDSGNKVIVAVANVWTPNKGIGYLLKLSKLLDNNIKLAIIGVSSRQKTKIIKEYGESIIAIEHTESIDELVDWYNRADVYINTTLEDNFPTTNIEALACGTPVITFRTGGSPECICDENGRIVEKGNLDELATAVIDILKTDKPQSICRQSAMKYNKDIKLREYVDLYEDSFNHSGLQ